VPDGFRGFEFQRTPSGHRGKMTSEIAKFRLHFMKFKEKTSKNLSLTFFVVGDDLTAGAFWFYINTTYFPYDLQFKVTE
jgi:hypothetical protein